MQTAEHHSSVNIFDKMAAVVASGHSLDSHQWRVQDLISGHNFNEILTRHSL